MIDDDDKKCGFFSLQFGISSSDGTKRQRDILRSSVRLVYYFLFFNQCGLFLLSSCSFAYNSGFS
jgi:hypothetical protein